MRGFQERPLVSRFLLLVQASCLVMMFEALLIVPFGLFGAVTGTQDARALSLAIVAILTCALALSGLVFLVTGRVRKRMGSPSLNAT